MSSPAETNESAHGSGDDAPVTMWLRQLERGDTDAAQPIYQHFCERLQALASQRIPATIRTAYDQDDAVVSAFHSLFHGLSQRRYQLDDRDDFWRLLLTIAERKIAKRIRYELREKRDVRRVVRDSMLLKVPNDQRDEARRGVDTLEGREPTPELAAEVSETCAALLESLPDEKSRQIALLKLENHTADEIASKLGCTRRTVQRKLLVIRRTWQHASGLENDADELSQSEDKRA